MAVSVPLTLVANTSASCIAGVSNTEQLPNPRANAAAKANSGRSRVILMSDLLNRLACSIECLARKQPHGFLGEGPKASVIQISTQMIRDYA
jgi:hypothetical protein